MSRVVLLFFLLLFPSSSFSLSSPAKEPPSLSPSPSEYPRPSKSRRLERWNRKAGSFNPQPSLPLSLSLPAFAFQLTLLSLARYPAGIARVWRTVGRRLIERVELVGACTFSSLFRSFRLDSSLSLFGVYLSHYKEKADYFPSFHASLFGLLGGEKGKERGEGMGRDASLSPWS